MLLIVKYTHVMTDTHFRGFISSELGISRSGSFSLAHVIFRFILKCLAYIMARRQRGGARDPMVQLSKSLAWVLRHGVDTMGLTMSEGGFLYADELLASPQYQKYTEADVRHVVMTNDKQRFHLETEKESGRLKIRANQGHTVKVECLDLTPVTSAQNFPRIVHGTYEAAWPSIKHQGLSCMNRNHIHFAPNDSQLATHPDQRGNGVSQQVSSGIKYMRSSHEIAIYVDLEAAIRDGYKFFQSANGVILTPGSDDGLLPVKYFKEVWRLKPRERITL